MPPPKLSCGTPHSPASDDEFMEKLGLLTGTHLCTHRLLHGVRRIALVGPIEFEKRDGSFASCRIPPCLRKAALIAVHSDSQPSGGLGVKPQAQSNSCAAASTDGGCDVHRSASPEMYWHPEHGSSVGCGIRSSRPRAGNVVTVGSASVAAGIGLAAATRRSHWRRPARRF